MFSANAQKDGTLGNEEITITKERKIVLPPATRLLEKIPSQAAITIPERTFEYSYKEYKPLPMTEIKFQPKVLPLPSPTKENSYQYSNQIRAGAGNYGRALGEAFLNSNQQSPLRFGIHYLHNSSSIGPVDDLLSAGRRTGGDASAIYQSSAFKVNLEGGFHSEKYNYYGYTTDLKPYIDPDKTKREQRNERDSQIGFRGNRLVVGAGIENTIPETIVDYKINTKLKNISVADFGFIESLKTTSPSLSYNPLRENDWLSNADIYFNIIEDKFFARLSGEASILQVNNDYEINSLPEDNDKYNRNLYKVLPTFTFFNSFLTITGGLRAINEYLPLDATNYTKAYPVVNITYKTATGLNFTAGVDGDMNRNSLGSVFQENPFLYIGRLKTRIKNTEKPLEVYLSSRGEVLGGLSYNAKVGYNRFKDLYFMNNSELITEKFDMFYEPEKINVYAFSGDLAYNVNEYWRAAIETKYNYYDLKTLDKPFHRPTFESKILNTFLVNEKLLASANFFFRGNVWAKNTISTEIVKLPAIYDMNIDIDYLFSKQFSLFVNLNNVFNQKYQRYQFYKTQGFNFVTGLKYQF